MPRVTGSQMETPSSDDKTVESAPTGSVKMVKVKANTTDKLKEGADKIEVTKHGLDEVEEGAENEDDENQGATTDNKSDEEDEEEDAEEDAEEDEEEEDEEDEEEDAEEDEEEVAVTELVTEVKVNKEIDGEVEPLAADVITGSKNAETWKEEEGGVKDSTTENNMPRKKAKKARRKATTNATASKEAVKAGEKVVAGIAGEEKGVKENDGPLKSMSVCLVPKSGNLVVGNGKEEKEVIDNAAKEITPIKKKAKRARRKTTANATASKEADKADESLNVDKKEGSAVVKKAKLADGMGLIFMCNTKTKQDCFRFKVLGLPASKKELVMKIYKGMRLFLFDADLKLMYGIFKAVTPGAFHIEPKAFNGAYPAQVRFTVFHDCLPLPEEKFKVALKENYYGRNQFDNKLSQEQVKKLCRLFQNASKNAKKRSRAETTEPLTTPPSKRREWTRTNNAVRSVRAESVRARDVRKAREPIHPPSRSHRSTPHGGSSRRTPPPSRRRERSAPRRREAYVSPRGGRPQDLDMYPRHREAYASPPRRAFAAPAPSALPYDYYYREDPLSAPPYPSMVDPRERRVRDLEMRQPLTRESHVQEYRGDGYNVYREARGLYPDSYYGPGSGLSAAQPAYAPVAQTAAYAPQMQAAYGLAAQAAYGSHPLYYHY